MRAALTLQVGPARSSTCEKVLALPVSFAINQATKTIELLLVFLLRLPEGVPQSFASAVRRNSDDCKPAFCRVGPDFRRVIQETRPSTKDPVFKAAHLNTALNPSSLSDPPVEYRVTSLDDIQFPIGQEGHGYLQGAARVTVTIPIINRRVI